MNTWIRNNRVRTAVVLAAMIVLAGVAGSLTLKAAEDDCFGNFLRGFYFLNYFFGNYSEVMTTLTGCLLREYQMCMRYL